MDQGLLNLSLNCNIDFYNLCLLYEKKKNKGRDNISFLIKCYDGYVTDEKDLLQDVPKSVSNSFLSMSNVQSSLGRRLAFCI